MLRKTLKLLALVTAMLMLVTSLAACTKKDDGTIRIGVLLPLTESEAVYGIDMFNAYKLAVDVINEAGGVLGRQLVLVEADDGANSDMAALAAEKIISSGVDFVVGGYASGATVPTLLPFHNADLMMLISAANSTRITEAGLPHFMINSPGSHAVLTLSELCKSLGVQNAALIHQGCDYSQNLAELSANELPKHGINIVATEVMPKGTPDVSTIVTNIRSSGADFVYWCGYHEDGSKVIRELRQGGYDGYIAVGDGSADRDLIRFSEEHGEGVFVTSPPFVEFAQGGEKFVADYTEKFGVEPGNYATLCYDTIYLLKDAIEKADSTETEKVHDAVQNIEFDGLSGKIKFTSKREPELSNFIVLKIEDGKFTLVNLD